MLQASIEKGKETLEEVVKCEATTLLCLLSVKGVIQSEHS